MKEIYNGVVLKWSLNAVILFTAYFNTFAQQNNTLFFMHSLPEANFINPAVQIDCGVFIGLPLLSSFHMNIANSGFSAGKYVTLYTDGSYARNYDFNTDRLPKRNYFLTELHSTLLAAGIKRNEFYYSFSITEKNNVVAIYTNDLVAFTLRGSGEFEGHQIVVKGTRFMVNHIREYAMGVSKKYSDNLTLGMKVKLLFGKFNFTSGNSSIGLSVEEGTRDIRFKIDGGFNSSMPYALREERPDVYRFAKLYDAPLLQHLMNRRNPGIAIDIGFIYTYNDRLTISGSLLDLGMIFYRSNLTNYALSGTHTYQGPFGNGSIDPSYLLDAFDALNANMTNELTGNPYTYFLDPRLYLGTAYKLNSRYDLNLLMYNHLLPGKIQTGATVSLITRPVKNMETSISWSYMNNSVANLGIGIGYGKNPLQVYLVSDNIVGFILPLSTKNINVRLGINLNLSCREVFNIDQCGCDWLKDSADHRSMMMKSRRGRKR